MQHAEYNVSRFGGSLKPITIIVSRRLRSRLAYYRLATPEEPALIAISRSHVRRHGWIEACETLLHEKWYTNGRTSPGFQSITDRGFAPRRGRSAPTPAPGDLSPRQHAAHQGRDRRTEVGRRRRRHRRIAAGRRVVNRGIRRTSHTRPRGIPAPQALSGHRPTQPAAGPRVAPRHLRAHPGKRYRRMDRHGCGVACHLRHPAAERLLQRDRTVLVGGRFLGGFSITFVEAFTDPLEQAARTRRSSRLTGTFRLSIGGSRSASTPSPTVSRSVRAMSPTGGASRKRCVGRYAVRQNQKLEAIGRLAGGIAHDFNNLLTAIKGYSELILADLLEASDGRVDVGHLRDDIDQIRKAADSAAGLTGQLLAFGWQQVMQPRLLDLNVYVAQMEKMLRRVISEDIEMRLALAKGVACVTADPRRSSKSS